MKSRYSLMVISGLEGPLKPDQEIEHVRKHDEIAKGNPRHE